MKSTDDRGLFATLIASAAASGNVNTIPSTQTTSGDGTASLALGFPPETFIARSAGGVPPRGGDMNGFLNLFSRALRAVQTGFFGQFNSSFAQSIGGYPAGAVVAGSVVGTFWVSTADDNTSTPGASGATWRNLFADYLPLTGGNITGSLTVEDNTVVVGVGGSNANAITQLSYDTNAGALGCLDTTGTWRYSRPLDDYSKFVGGWGVNGYIEIPTNGNWKFVQQWVQFQGTTGTGGNLNGAYETEDIFVSWPLGMGNLFRIAGLSVEDVGGVGMNEKVWAMKNPTATGGSFRLACNESGVTMTGSALIIGGVAA